MKKFTLLFLLISVVAVSGCKGSKKEEDKNESVDKRTQVERKVVARVNDRPVYEDQIKGKDFDSAIADEILYEVGIKKGVDKEVEPEVEQYRKRLVLNRIKRPIMMGTPKDKNVSDEDIQAYYDKNKVKYSIINLKEISVKDKTKAEEIRTKALAGEDFDKLATDAGTKARDLRYNRRYSNIFVGKGAGSVSDVIQEGNEYKVLKMVDMKEIPLEKVKQSISYAIMAIKRNEAINQKAEQLKEENNIKVEILETPTPQPDETQ